MVCASKRVWACVALLLGMCSSSAHAQSLGLRDFPVDENLSPFGITRRWFIQLPLQNGQEKIIGIKAHEELLFAQSDKGVLHCLVAETGQKKWSAVVSSIAADVHPPAVTLDAVYVCSGRTLKKLNRETGRLIYEHDLPTAASGGPACNEDYLFVPLSNYYMQALYLNDPYNRIANRLPVAWHLNAGAPIKNAPIVLSDRVAVVAENGIVYCSHLKRRDEFFRFILEAGVTAPLSSMDGVLYLASKDTSLYAIDLRTGKDRWRFVSGFPLATKPLPFVNEILVIGENGGGLHSVSTNTGELRWPRIERANRLIGVSEDRIYAFDDHNNVLVISRKDGSIDGSWAASSFSVSTENQYNDRLFMASPSGVVVSLHERKHANPFIHPQKSILDESAEMEKKTEEPTKKKKSFFEDDDTSPAPKREAAPKKEPAAEKPATPKKPKSEAKKPAKTKSEKKDRKSSKKKKKDDEG